MVAAPSPGYTRTRAKFRALYPVQARHAAPDMSLRDFIAGAWAVLEPSTPYVHNWHIDTICAHLEAVTRGDIRNLLINVPPGHMKSLITCVFWPAWEWTFRPDTRWLAASYSPQLSTRDALKTRRLMQSRWYQERYGLIFRLSGDQNAKTRYENDATGFRIATSVGGVATGERADRLVVDDPHNARERDRDVARATVLDWWDSSFANRVNNPEKSARVVIMQRLHDNDLAGHILALGGFDHLMLPAEYEPSRATVTALGTPDPRTEDGALLWPSRFPITVLDEERKRLGPYGYAGQMQQNPVPREGGMFPRAWWQRYAALPRLTRVEQFVDSSFKVGVVNDPSACATWGTDGLGNYYVIDYWEARVAYPDLMQALHDQHNKHRHRAATVPLTIEDKASGQSALQTLARPLPLPGGVILPRLPVLPFPLLRRPGVKSRAVEREHELAAVSKDARAESVTPLVAAGSVYLPADAPWVDAFITAHERFPNAEHDEAVDTTSMALIRLSAPPERPFAASVGGERNIPVPR